MYTLLFTLLLSSIATALPLQECAHCNFPGIPMRPKPWDVPERFRHLIDWWGQSEAPQNEASSQQLPQHEVARDTTIVARDAAAVEDMAGVYICEDVGWGGSCTHYSTPLGSAPESCTTLDARASSIGPDLGFDCIFYTNAFCDPLASNGSDSLSVSYPGIDNLLVTEKGDFNDRLNSFQCFRRLGEGGGGKMGKHEDDKNGDEVGDEDGDVYSSPSSRDE